MMYTVNVNILLLISMFDATIHNLSILNVTMRLKSSPFILKWVSHVFSGDQFLLGTLVAILQMHS